METFGRIGHRYGRAQCGMELATIHRRLGDSATALAVLESAVETLRICGDHWMEADAARRLAVALAQTPRREAAIALLRHAARLFGRVGDGPSAKEARRLQHNFERRRWKTAAKVYPQFADGTG
jgi:hypothetical protein